MSATSIQDMLTKTSTEFNQALKKTASESDNMGKEQFLQLLVTQLKYQDPLNPMEDQEFIAQMAQFSSLEQLVNLNTSMESLTEATNNQQMFSATSYIGKYVTAVGNNIGKTSTLDEDGKVTSTAVTPMYYRFNSNTERGTITVYDEAGTPVYVENLNAMTSTTTYRFQWDGKDNQGKVLKDGSYTVAVTGFNEAGESVLCTPLVADKVTDVMRDGSKIYLRLEGGQQMLLSDVELVSQERPVISTEDGNPANADENKVADSSDPADSSNPDANNADPSNVNNTGDPNASNNGATNANNGTVDVDSNVSPLPNAA